MGYTHGIRWTEEKIEQSILYVISELKLDRMPTRKEIISIYGDDTLTNKISKSLGYYGWAEKLGLKVQSNCTNVGKEAEKYVCNQLLQLGFSPKQMLQNYPFDLLVNEVCKVDVKYSNLYKGKNGNFYSFSLRKQPATCDFYILVAENDRKAKTIYVVPACTVNQKHISIGEVNSAYHIYENRFDLLTEYIDMVSELFPRGVI